MELEVINEYNTVLFDFSLTSYQLDFFYSCMNYKRVVAVFCRQSGKSETTSKVAIMMARHITDNPVLIFAPTDRQCGLIALKIVNTVKKMLYLEDFHIIRQTQREFYFSNGGSIICETTGDNGETIRGYTAGAIILEEAGTIKDSIIHNSILPMGAHTDPPIIKIGTPRGMNHFYESSMDETYQIHQIPWMIAVKEGILAQSYVDDMKNTLPIETFKTEMLAEFVPDEDAYFSYKLIEGCTDMNLKEQGRLEGQTYFLGVDIARSGKDHTVLMIIKKGEVSELVRIVDIPECTLDRVMDRIEELHFEYGFEKIYLDETGLGAGVRDVLARKYNPYKPMNSMSSNRTFSMADLIVGTHFTIQSKVDIFSRLKVLMEQGKLKLPNNRKLISQLRDFRYEMTDSGNMKLHHSEYGFDDYCDSLALAVQGLGSDGYILDLG